MAREIGIGDVVAVTATVGKRIEDRVTLSVPGYHYPYSIIDEKAKPGDKLRIEGEVTRFDKDDGRVTFKGMTFDADAGELVSKYRRPQGTEPLRQK